MPKTRQKNLSRSMRFKCQAKLFLNLHFYFDGAQLWQRPCIFCPIITVYNNHFAVIFLKACYSPCNVDVVVNKRHKLSNSRYDGCFRQAAWHWCKHSGLRPVSSENCTSWGLFTKGEWTTGSVWPSQSTGITSGLLFLYTHRPSYAWMCSHFQLRK